MTSNKDRLPPGSTILMVGILMFCEYGSSESFVLLVSLARIWLPRP
jgi:hypothetical protein